MCIRDRSLRSQRPSAKVFKCLDGAWNWALHRLRFYPLKGIKSYAIRALTAYGNGGSVVEAVVGAKSPGLVPQRVFQAVVKERSWYGGVISQQWGSWFLYEATSRVPL